MGDRVLDKDKKWLDPTSDPTDFFNHGHTLETWLACCQRFKSFHIEMSHNLHIMTYQKGFGVYDRNMDMGRPAGTWNHQVWIPTILDYLYERTPDLSLQITAVREGRYAKSRKLTSLRKVDF